MKLIVRGLETGEVERIRSGAPDANGQGALTRVAEGVANPCRHCLDLIAEGVITAVKAVGVKLPVVVRLQGTNAEKAREMLAASGLAVIAASDLTDAAKKVVAAAR